MAKAAKKIVTPTVVITDIELISIQSSRLQLLELRRQVKVAEAEVERLENDVILKIRAGAAFAGKLVASIQATIGSIRPAWKELFLAHQETHGIARAVAEAEVKAKTTPSTGEELVIAAKPVLLP